MKTFHILLVEDDPDDIELFQDAIMDSGFDNKIDVITQGDRVLTYLEQQQKLPDVIVLDLNLPKISGKEVLNLLKSASNFSDIPVIILSTSNSKMDIENCLDAGASQFIPKPVNTKGFASMAQVVFEIAQGNVLH